MLTRPARAAAQASPTKSRPNKISAIHALAINPPCATQYPAPSAGVMLTARLNTIACAATANPAPMRNHARSTKR